MPEVTTAETKASTIFDQLRTNVLVDTSSKSRAFSDFLGLMAEPGVSTSQNASAAISPVLDTATTAAAQTHAAVATATAPAEAAATTVSTAQTSIETGTAKNAPVSREAFEQAKPLLAKAGVTDTEMADLAARVQAGTLTWGQLVQNLGSHMTGAKKAVALSASDGADLQSMFQKLGFAADVSSQMVKSVSQGDGLKVLASVQNKLATLSDDSALGLDKNQLNTFFKAMNVPAETAARLTKLLGPESTVADMKLALAQISQSMQDQRVKSTQADTELAKSLGKIMEKDTAKHARDATQTVTPGNTGSTDAQVGFELKTKDQNDMSWFDQREKTPQQKSAERESDAAWRSFTSKVRADETSATTQASGQQAAQAAATSKESSLDALSRAGQGVNVQQGKAEAALLAKSAEKPAAPKVLDQVSEAMLKDLGQGRKQMTIQLDPENLGKAQIILQLKGKEISALIQVEDAQTAAMLSSNMESLKKTLEDQGLTVQNLEVQAGLTSRQDQQAAFNADQHNQAQERQELSRMISQMRMLRGEGGDMAPDMQNVHMQAILADQGLHIIA